MIDAINEWKRMLVGNAEWCDDTVESLKLEEGICREFADSVLVEMEAKILNHDNMDKVLQKSLSDMNKKLQTGLALGAMVLRPLGPDKIEYVAADKFIPISFDDNGVLNDIAFLVVKCIGENDYYTRVRSLLDIRIWKNESCKTLFGESLRLVRLQVLQIGRLIGYGSWDILQRISNGR